MEELAVLTAVRDADREAPECELVEAGSPSVSSDPSADSEWAPESNEAVDTGIILICDDLKNQNYASLQPAQNLYKSKYTLEF